MKKLLYSELSGAQLGGAPTAGIESDRMDVRLRSAVTIAWRLFARKVGGGVVTVHKEASMQLQYAYLLQQITPMIAFNESESIYLSLESGLRLRERNREIDLLLVGKTSSQEYRIAIEMKCYRARAASGKLRGATDIFMRDVYEDLQLLEHYVEDGIAEEGIALVMTDLARLVQPPEKAAKCWAYDTSHGAKFGPRHYDVPIGGKPVAITLQRSYALDWLRAGDFWFLEAQGA
ncbi:hypothetical protein [Pandoraea communis]|uniref:hypothetical protein n=1 Tax=Pandoraea communis TaxID=2508297 RepID=UPI0025A5C51B|nr:hypothetical protein [Pandoraea communis]MDM8359060.1 hypothetical protein [Pandoraea communis]